MNHLFKVYSAIANLFSKGNKNENYEKALCIIEESKNAFAT